MNEREAFKYCPRCGKESSNNTKEKNLFKCSFCQFEFYFNGRPCAQAILLKDNKILLVKRNIEPFKGNWEIPGGFLNIGESLDEALKREMNEELGIKIIKSEYLVSLPAIYPYQGIDLNVVANYFICDFSGPIKLNKEIGEIKYFSLNHIPRNTHKIHKKAIKFYRSNSKD